MKQVVLSLAPLPAELVKALILQTVGVPDFDVVFGHEMSREELTEAMARADVVLGDYTFKQGIVEAVLGQSRLDEAHPAAERRLPAHRCRGMHASEHQGGQYARSEYGQRCRAYDRLGPVPSQESVCRPAGYEAGKVGADGGQACRACRQDLGARRLRARSERQWR